MRDSDEALYERLLAGDMTAFDALYRRYERPLFGFIRRYVTDVAQAEDVFQEAFLAVLRERDHPDRKLSFKAWLYRVARNLCLNRLRGRDRAIRALDAAAHEVPPQVEGPEASAIRADTTEAVRRAVARLPEHLAEVYALRAAGMTYEGVAEVLDIPIGTVKSRMSSMIRSLREEMKHDLR